MDTDVDGNNPKMSLEEVAAYRNELHAELTELQFAQEMVWSQYKQDRINRLKQRLGLPID